MNKKLLIYVCLTTGLFADRWLILPPRIELQNEKLQAGDLARAMALYAKVSRVTQIVSVAEGEGCLKQANGDMTQKISPEVLAAVAKNCMAERTLVTRIRKRDKEYEITSKVFFRESSVLSDTLVSTGENLLTVLGQNLSERFGKTPATPKESSADLIVAGDIYGGVYFDWLELKNYFLSLDAVKSAYCLIDARGELMRANLNSDRSRQKEFLDRLKFSGSGMFAGSDTMGDCVKNAVSVTRQEGRRAQILFLVSDFPRGSAAELKTRALMRSLARAGKLLIAPASTASESAQKFWATMSRELGENALYLPLAQHAKVGLAGGQEWHIFRQSGRLYESRSEKPKELTGGVKIPGNLADETGLTDLVKLYEKLSKNKAISATTPGVDATRLKGKLAAAFKTSADTAASWRVQLSQNGQSYFLNLDAKTARGLKPESFVRIFTELKSPSENQFIRNRPTPAVVIENAADSAPGLELDVTDFMRQSGKYLRHSIGGRSFYIMTGKVVQVFPPDGDAMDSGF